jgi:hypothetical protein
MGWELDDVKSIGVGEIYRVAWDGSDGAIRAVTTQDLKILSSVTLWHSTRPAIRKAATVSYNNFPTLEPRQPGKSSAKVVARFFVYLIAGMGVTVIIVIVFLVG